MGLPKRTLNGWKLWTNPLLEAGPPSLWGFVDVDLSELDSWFSNRVWLKRYSDLEQAFETFHRVLRDLRKLFHSEVHERSKDTHHLMPRQFYDVSDPDGRKNLINCYNHQFAIVGDLTLELTRAGNLICDRVRESFLPSYRIAEGSLVVRIGPYLNNRNRMMYQELVPSYSPGEKARLSPYAGLDAFKFERMERDFWSGVGEQPKTATQRRVWSNAPAPLVIPRRLQISSFRSYPTITHDNVLYHA
jgi:hypothetical protein